MRSSATGSTRSGWRSLAAAVTLGVGGLLALAACSGDDGSGSSTTSTTRAAVGSTTTAARPLDLTRPFGPHTPPVESLDDVEMAFPVRAPVGAGAPDLEYAQGDGDAGFEEYAGVFTVDGETIVVSQALADAPTTSTGEPQTLANGLEALVTDTGGVVSAAWSEPRADRYLRIVVYGASGAVSIDDVVAFAGTIPATP